MKTEMPGTHQKALEINLDPTKYGAFAEVGAGQEVARWFFRVGGASGTIAKTMSAYDMTVSDAVYGAAERYVSRERLLRMLDHEYHLLTERLAAKRGATTRFFAFANTVAASRYLQKDEAHGWMGIRYQPTPGADPSQIILHIRMLDSENVQQQEALGVIGVNLIHAALYHGEKPDEVLASLLDQLSRDRIELDFIHFSGPAFGSLDNRLPNLQLVARGLAESTLFTAQGEVTQAAEVLYKKAILVVRGSFRPVTHATLDLLERALERFSQAPKAAAHPVVALTEMTLRHLAENAAIDPQDFLERADTLTALGLPVLISSYARYFRLAAYLLRHTKGPIGIALGVRRLRELFDDHYYTDLDGGILEAFGRMFKSGLRVYVYPVREGEPPATVTAQTLQVAPHLRHLYAHLLENGFIQDLQAAHSNHLRIYARDVLAAIRANDPSWPKLVPLKVAEIIRARRLFGFRG